MQEDRHHGITYTNIIIIATTLSKCELFSRLFPSLISAPFVRSPHFAATTVMAFRCLLACSHHVLFRKNHDDSLVRMNDLHICAERDASGRQTLQNTGIKSSARRDNVQRSDRHESPRGKQTHGKPARRPCLWYPFKY